MIGRAIVVWLALLVVIVILGGLRDALLAPRVGELRAHQLGTLAACAAVLVVVCVMLPWVGPVTPDQALGLGAFWVALAVGFEVGFFHFARKMPWSDLMADYNLAEGRLLVLLWITVLLAPLVCFLAHGSSG